MADVASRSFGKNLVTDTFFLSHFSITFPLPQQYSWRYMHSSPYMTLLVTLTLHGTRLPLQPCMTEYKPKNGTSGCNSAQTCDKTLTYRTAPPPSNSTSSSVLLHRTGRTTTVGAAKLLLKYQKPRSVTWHKPSLCQAILPPADNMATQISTYPSPSY